MKTLLMSLAVAALLSVGTLTAVLAEDTTTPAPRAPKAAAHEATPPVIATGTVSKIETPKDTSSSVKFTLTVDANTTYRVLTAPDAVIKMKGLTLANDATVTVTGMTSEQAGRDGTKMTFLRAQTIVLGQTNCVLIEKGKATWKLDDIAPFITATGTVKNLEQPEPPAAAAPTTTTPAATGTPAPRATPKKVTFTLATDKEELKFSYGSRDAEKLGLTLANDQKITVTYWKFAGSDRVTLRDITPDGGKSCTFNDGSNVGYMIR